MTNHAIVGRDEAQGVAAQVRAELARRGHTAGDLATMLGTTPHTVGRRLNGRVSFTAVEIMQIAAWLDIDVAALFPARRARGAA